MLLASHIVPADFEERTRLQEYAISIFCDCIPSAKGIKKAIKRGQVYVDGNPAATAHWVLPNQCIELFERTDQPPKSYELDLEIVFEDEHIAVINKPAGINVSGNKFRTIQNCLVSNLAPSRERDALPWPRPVHRLDNPTSGLLLCAKTHRALSRLGNQFQERSVEKTYHAIVMGNPPDAGTLDFRVGDLEAETHFKRLKTLPSLRSEYLSLLQLKPKTGRTHQLRIHCAEAGWPILGDKQYGPEGNTLLHHGLFLCATQLVVEHPVSLSKVVFEVELPHKFLARLESEERRWKKFNAS